MIRPRILIAALMIASLSDAARAEHGKLTIKLSMRARVETIGGQFRPAPAPHRDQALAIQTDLSGEYDAGRFRVGGEVVDSRVYFERRRSSAGTTEINALEPVQAYVAADIGQRAETRVGRFTLNLGSRRLIARNMFRNSINGFTGIEGVFGTDRIGATAFWTVAQTRLPNDIDGLRANRVELDRERGSPHFLGLFLHGDTAIGTVESYGYRLAENDSADIATRNRHLWTVGARLYRPPSADRWDYELEAAGQGGHARATSAPRDRVDRPVRAELIHATIGRSLPGTWHPRIALLADYASGQRSGRALTRFDTLYGARVFEFGPSSLFGAVQRGNLVSAALSVEAKPDMRSEISATVRPLFLASHTDSFAATGVIDQAGRAGNHAGTQIDVRYRRFLIPGKLRASVGAAYLAKGRFLRDAANAPVTGDTAYGFVELIATP
jgi:hypothetical protein